MEATASAAMTGPCWWTTTIVARAPLADVEDDDPHGEQPDRPERGAEHHAVREAISSLIGLAHPVAEPAHAFR